MKVYENEEYREDIKAVAGLQLPWEMFENSSILISGASGLVGSYLIDVIMRKNANNGMNCTIYALGRNKKNAKERFGYCISIGLSIYPDFFFKGSMIPLVN